MLAIQIVMPSEGDMILLLQDQEGGAILLQPVFYGKVCGGPHIQVVEVDKDHKITGIKSRCRLQINSDGKLEIKKGYASGEQEDEKP